MKQVAHIRQMSDALRRRFGRERRIGKHVVHTFPEAEALADSTEADLRACGLGYRAKNLRLTADRVASGEADLTAWQALPDRILREYLCELPGVGAKVANCVMLFAFERLEAFPIDVWIARVLKERYFPRTRNLTEKQMRNFSRGYFGPHGGYAQQYLFHHARKTTPRKRAKGRAVGRIATKTSANG
jgi:N-glycosylase/DNA lyase